jgi:hypothetical protein
VLVKNATHGTGSGVRPGATQLAFAGKKKIGAVMRSIPSSTGDISLEMFENESGHRDRVHLKVWIK